MSGLVLRIHGFLPRSLANGPGVRSVAWVQGCSLGCPGCYNPQTHPHSGGQLVAVDDLFDRMAAPETSVEGITLSGGEPLQQRGPVVALLRRVREETRLSAVLFTGYTWEEVQRLPEAGALVSCLDVLIAGRYDATQRLARELRGSSNKTVHLLSARYQMQDLQSASPAEVVIRADGQVMLSGIDPPAWRRESP